MKKLLIGLILLNCVSTSFAAEVWNCESADKQTKLTITFDKSGSHSSYNGIILNSVSFDNMSLEGHEGTRDTYDYELKLMKDDRDSKNSARAILFIDESIDCLGRYTDFVSLSCSFKK